MEGIAKAPRDVTDKVLDKLKKLYGLAKLSDDERALYADGKLDDGRLNEARTAAFLLIHTARTNGIKVTFTPANAPSKPRDHGSMPRSGSYGGGGTDDLGDMFADMMRQAVYAARQRSEQAMQEERMRREEVDRRARAEAQEIRNRSVREAQQKAKTHAHGHPFVVTDDPFKPDPFFDSMNTGMPFKRPQSRPNPKYPPPRAEPNAPPLITSKFPGVCLTCRKLYVAGEKVWWVRNVGAAHEACGYDELLRVEGDEPA